MVRRFVPCQESFWYNGMEVSTILGEIWYNGTEVCSMLGEFWYNGFEVCTMLGEFSYIATMVRMIAPC